MESNFLQSFVTLFSVVDPPAGAAVFMALAANASPAERKRVALRAALTTVIVLLLFLFLGNAIFAFFSITMSAFRVAGGIVIGIMALDLLKATQTGMRSTPGERMEGQMKADLSITPLAIPMLAGPGAISTVMILSARGDGGLPATLELIAVIALVALFVWIFLRESEWVVQRLGETGLNVLSRLMGLVVLAIAVQFIAEGLAELFSTHLS